MGGASQFTAAHFRWHVPWLQSNLSLLVLCVCAEEDVPPSSDTVGGGEGEGTSDGSWGTPAEEGSSDSNMSSDEEVRVP